MPTRGAVSIETMLCLRENMDGYPYRLLVVFRKPIIEASISLLQMARELSTDCLDFDPRHILGVADDAWWAPGTIKRAVTILEKNPRHCMVAPIGGFRLPFAPPTCVTAMRQGELMGLTRDDLHLDDGYLLVRHNLARTENGLALVDPKTKILVVALTCQVKRCGLCEITSSVNRRTTSA